MSKMIAYCGLICSNCPTFIATQTDDDAARERAVALYAQKFGIKLQKEDINCEGCLSEGGRKIGYCQVCEIRQCCLSKALKHCAVCPEQPCEKLRRFHKLSREAKAGFETLKNG